MFAVHSWGMTNDDKQRHQRPEGQLLERAMKGPPKVSGRRLAELADLSEGRVRQIVNGYKTESGMTLPVVAPAETLARLGNALQLVAEDFEEVGRDDVAEIIRGEISSGVTEEGDLWLADPDGLRVELLDWLNSGVESDPPEGPLMLWHMDGLLRAVAKKHRDELHFQQSLVKIFRDKQHRGGDGDAEDTRGSAPTRADIVFPGQINMDLAAHDEDHPIEDEQQSDAP